MRDETEQRSVSVDRDLVLDTAGEENLQPRVLGLPNSDLRNFSFYFGFFLFFGRVMSVEPS